MQKIQQETINRDIIPVDVEKLPDDATIPEVIRDVQESLEDLAQNTIPSQKDVH